MKLRVRVIAKLKIEVKRAKPKRKPRRIYVVSCACQNWIDAYRNLGDAARDAQHDHDTIRCRRTRVVTFEEVLR